MSVLRVEHLTVRFEGAEQAAIEDVSFALEPGQIVMVIGPNGSGKTTLLRAILGFVPFSGTIEVFGTPVRQAYHQIGYVPQHLRFDPTLPLTGREILRMPLQNLPRQARPAPLDWATTTFQLDAFLGQPIGTLSGGQFKRLLLARAMMHQPRLLLLDEPESGVDVGGERILYRLLEQLVEEHQITALISSHELNIVLQVASKVICLNRRLFGIGPPTQMLQAETIFQLYGSDAALYRHEHERPG